MKKEPISIIRFSSDKNIYMECYKHKYIIFADGNQVGKKKTFFEARKYIKNLLNNLSGNYPVE